MKKSILLMALIISSLICSAQLEVKEGSFKKVEGFVNINTEKMFDDNDRPYAVLKIRTENLDNKQRRELGFGGDARTFFETEYKDGEVWLYISYYATFIKISHPDLSSTEFWFPFDMEPKKGYELTLVNKPSVDEDFQRRLEKLENATAEAAKHSDDYGYIVVKTGSLEGATVYIDGEEMEMKTPFVSDPIEQGPHIIRVVKDGYENFTDIVDVVGKGTRTVNVDLKHVKIVNSTRNKGFVFNPEISAAIDIGFHDDAVIDNHTMFMPQLNIEYVFGTRFGIGVGTGVMYFNNSFDAVPIYAQISYYLNNRKIAPFINVRIGYSINLNTYEFTNGSFELYDYKTSGMTGTVTLGVNINHSSIGLLFEMVNYQYYRYFYGTYSSIKGKYYFVGLSYSYRIPFGKK